MFSMLRRKYVLTQTNVAATDVRLRLAMSNGCWAEILSLKVGPEAGAYAANRNLSVRVLSDDGATPIESFPNVSVTGAGPAHVSPVVPTADPAENNAPRRVGDAWRVSGPDRLDVRMLACAQNETMTVMLRALVAHGGMTASSPVAGVTLTETEE